ncbi:hypothetical protein [Monaibacterium marinum]|uniref:hypothetical protein n=1 Tax=Pontivivens marinum TaxID=1690039 RepID=UPI0011AF526C|nr:hypothetical protein [Monaibacterium marinum]
MSDKDSRTEETKRADRVRAERLAAQLRSNLRRRKTQTRARKDADEKAPLRDDGSASKQD